MTLPTLTPALLRSGALAGRAGGVTAPPAELLDLPERAVQFGTGAFLRGFVDYFSDAACKVPKSQLHADSVATLLRMFPRAKDTTGTAWAQPAGVGPLRHLA